MSGYFAIAATVLLDKLYEGMIRRHYGFFGKVVSRVENKWAESRVPYCFPHRLTRQFFLSGIVEEVKHHHIRQFFLDPSFCLPKAAFKDHVNIRQLFRYRIPSRFPYSKVVFD